MCLVLFRHQVPRSPACQPSRLSTVLACLHDGPVHSCSFGSARVTAAPLVAMFRPFQADSTETLWCLLCCVVIELCRRVRLTDGGTVATGRLPASEGEGFPCRAAREEAHRAKRQLQCLRRSPTLWMRVLLPWEVMKTCSMVSSQCTIPLIGRLMKRSWKFFPGTAPAAIAGPDRSDRRLRKSA